MASSDDLGQSGEELFQAYLENRSMRFASHQPAGAALPDFWIDHDDETVVCEVKSLSARLPPDIVGSFDPYPPLRQAIKRASRQGSEVKGAHPYVLVLYAPGWPTDEIVVAGAMFGNVGVTIPVGPGVTDGFDRATSTFLGGGRLQTEMNTRFSALAVVEYVSPGQILLNRTVAGRTDGMTLKDGVALVTETAEQLEAEGLLADEDRVPRVDVYMNPFAAVPLPEDLFVGPFDRMYSIDYAGSFELRMMGTGLEGFDE